MLAKVAQLASPAYNTRVFFWWGNDSSAGVIMRILRDAERYEEVATAAAAAAEA